MDEATLRKLKANPHYNMSRKQREQLEELERKPMVEFASKGHNARGDVHNNQSVKKKNNKKAHENK